MIEKLIKLVKEDKIIKKELFSGKNLNELLDLRDERVFDDEWIKIYDALKQLGKNISNVDLINQIREEIFLKSYGLTQSSEISSCISDDFELIIKAFMINYNNDWLNALAVCYMEDIFPCGELKKTNFKIHEIMHKILI